MFENEPVQSSLKQKKTVRANPIQHTASLPEGLQVPQGPSESRARSLAALQDGFRVPQLPCPELHSLCVQTWDLLVTRNAGIKGVLLFHIVPFLFLGAGSSRSRARKKEQLGTII